MSAITNKIGCGGIRYEKFGKKLNSVVCTYSLGNTDAKLLYDVLEEPKKNQSNSSDREEKRNETSIREGGLTRN